MWTLSPPEERLGRPPVAYSVAICSMWSLSSLYCSGRETDVTLEEKDRGAVGQVLLSTLGRDKPGPHRGAVGEGLGRCAVAQSPRPRMLHIRHEREPGSGLRGKGSPCLWNDSAEAGPRALPEVGGRPCAGR